MEKTKEEMNEVPKKWKWEKCYEIEYSDHGKYYIRKHWALKRADTDIPQKGVVSLGLISLDCHSDKKEFMNDPCIQFVESAPERISELSSQLSSAVELLKYFVDRVEAGTIKSKTTYKMYKNFLTQLNKMEK